MDLDDLAADHGFALHGICAAAPAERPDYVRAWIRAGQHGGMGYLEERLELHLDVAGVLPNVRSILCVADAYGNTTPTTPTPTTPTPTAPAPAPAPPGETASAVRPPPGNAPPTPTGRVARYAWGRDYHRSLKGRLHRLADGLRAAHPDADFRCTVDTAPVMEREHAQRGGLGFIGKHTLLIHPRHGSFLLLGCVLSTLPPDAWGGATPPLTLGDCGTCTRYIDACPTDAIDPEGYRLDATRCISYLTLEHRDAIAPELHAGMGDWLGGCDICQDVCPYNAAGTRRPLPVPLDYRPRAHAAGLDLADVLSWDENDRFNALSGTPLMRIKLWMWKRNALIAAGNAGGRDDPTLRPLMEAMREHEHPAVRVTADAVLDTP